MKPLEIPNTVLDDPKATEIARIWAAHDKMHVHIQTGLWPDAGNWGIMLADFAKHIANAYEQDGRGDYFKVLARIREIFEAEWDSPTDIPTGTLTRKPPGDEPTP
ncbi:MAG: hypothetical protein QOH39_893 [Verrucomicrobiota bacterium]|jgi:hypothetical protein